MENVTGYSALTSSYILISPQLQTLLPQHLNQMKIELNHPYELSAYGPGTEHR